MRKQDDELDRDEKEQDLLNWFKSPRKKCQPVDVALSFLLYFCWKLLVDSVKLKELGESSMGIDFYTAMVTVVDLVIWIYIFSTLFYYQKMVMRRELIVIISIILVIIYGFIQGI